MGKKKKKERKIKSQEAQAERTGWRLFKEQFRVLEIFTYLERNNEGLIPVSR